MTIGTTYTDIEPIGFGLSPFGDAESATDEMEFGRGFGDATTVYTTYEDD